MLIELWERHVIKQTEEFTNILKPLITKIDEMNILLQEIRNEIYKKKQQYKFL